MLIEALAIEAALIGATAEEAAADDFMKPNDEEQSLFVRLIKAGRSLNTVTNYDYPADVLAEATPLFNGAHVYMNHADPDAMRRNKGVRRVEDKVGRIVSPRWNATVLASEGRMVVFDRATYDRLKRGGDAYGLSMEADLLADPNIRAVPRRVGKVVKVKAVAIVDMAGAGGSIYTAAEAAYKEAEEAAREEHPIMELTADEIKKAVQTGITEYMAAAKAEEAAHNQTDWQAEAEAANTKLARYAALDAARAVGSELNAASKTKLGGYTLATACEAALNDVADYQLDTIKAAVTARYNALIADVPAVTNPIRGMGTASAAEAAAQPTPPQARSDYQLAKDIWKIGNPTTQNGGAANGR